jgi:hypothetical protein
MKVYTVKLQGTTPMLFGRQYVVPKEQRESHAEYEERTWRERLHKDEAGNVVLSPLSVKNCLRDAAKYLSEQIPGKGKSTYTKHFKSGLMVFEQVPVRDGKNQPIKAESVEPLWLNVPSDGMTGGTKRVPKAFPQVKEWTGIVDIHVLDEVITKDVLLRHLTEAGNFIGLGAMRVANGGISGRFKVISINEAK